MAFVDVKVAITGKVCSSTHTTTHWKRNGQEGAQVTTTFVQDYTTWTPEELLEVVHKKQVIDVGQPYLRGLESPQFKALNNATIDLSTCRNERKVVVRAQTQAEIVENFATMSKDEQMTFMAELMKVQK